MSRHPDLVKAYGRDAFADAMEHWVNDGEDEGRNGRPATPFNGTLPGPVASGGGDGGTLWSDGDFCSPGQFVDGFRLGTDSEVKSVQFRYGGRWANRHGGDKADHWVEEELKPGEYISRVDFRSADRLDQVKFTTSQGRVLGHYGGGGGHATVFTLPPGEKLGCMFGRSGGSIDRLHFPSNGMR